MTDMIIREAAIAMVRSGIDLVSKAYSVGASGRLDAMIDALTDVSDNLRALPAVGVTALVWEEGDRNGGFYCEFPIGHGFSAYYEITQEPYDLATVVFGISCHEFGDKEIWKGPKADAKAAAQADYAARIRSALTATPAQDVAEIDLRAVMMDEIERAACQSPWVPPEYTMNEVVSDCCSFLREPRDPSPDVAKLVEARRKHIKLVGNYRTKRDEVNKLRDAGDWSQNIDAEFQAMEAGRRDFFEAAQTFADAALARMKEATP